MRTHNSTACNYQAWIKSSSTETISCNVKLYVLIRNFPFHRWFIQYETQKIWSFIFRKVCFDTPTTAKPARLEGFPERRTRSESERRPGALPAGDGVLAPWPCHASVRPCLPFLLAWLSPSCLFSPFFVCLSLYLPISFPFMSSCFLIVCLSPSDLFIFL